MWCSLCPIKDLSCYLHTAVDLLAYRRGYPQKVHKSSHDGLQNFITPTFLNIVPMISQSEDRVLGISSFPH